MKNISKLKARFPVLKGLNNAKNPVSKSTHFPQKICQTEGMYPRDFFLKKKHTELNSHLSFSQSS